MAQRNSNAQRSVVKYGVMVSQVKPSKLFQIYTLRQWFPNTQQSRFLAVCRRLEKLVLPSIFDRSPSSLMMWNLQLSNNIF